MALLRDSRSRSGNGTSPETISDDGSVPSPVSEISATLEGVRLAETEGEGDDALQTSLRSELGYDEDLVTPTPHRPTSPKKDYFTFNPGVGSRLPPARQDPLRTRDPEASRSGEQEPPRTREQGMGRSAFFWKRW